ncbi:MAG TPA: TIGR03936 family radical SAM-associated protein [Tepidiformaceae bacterium]|nr:TIGR03936 family radical SAM-associated protein [Tepidiformaceae bacterium]
MTQQRIRVWFTKGERVKYISHLDVLRFWERAIRRADLPLSYSQGFTPHPKLAFASPLPMGFVAEREVMDVTLDERVPIEQFACRLRSEATADLSVVDVMEVALSAPPPQAAMLWADYRVELPGVAEGAARKAVDDFLRLESLPWREERGERIREYDLRQATAHAGVQSCGAGCELRLRMRADQELTARPEAVVACLFPGVAAGTIARTGIILDERSQARELWRRFGQYQ